MRAIRVEAFGSPEVIQVVELPIPQPGPGQVRVRAEAIGVNNADTYMRKGAFPIAAPTGLGLEAVGIVDAIGEGVEDFRIGERVGYYTGTFSAYAEQNVVDARALVSVPDISPVIAVSLLTKGITAELLLHRAHKVEPGDKILVHAAAGGVGQLLTQWGNALGATVFAAVGSTDKFAAASDSGAEFVINSQDPNWAKRVRELAPDGLDVVYDSIGKSTYEGSLDVLRIRGTLVFFGTSSGPVPALDIQALGRRGSFSLTYAAGPHFSRTPDEIRQGMSRVFAAYEAGILKPRIHQTLNLSDAADAHRLLESRATTGALVLVP